MSDTKKLTLEEINGRLEEIATYLSEASDTAGVVGEAIHSTDKRQAGAVFGVDRIIRSANHKTQALIHDVMAADE